MQPIQHPPMRSTFLPFSRPSFDEQESQQILECLTSGWLAPGPRVAAFQAAFAAYHGVPVESVLLTNNCTSALYLACRSMDLQPGDEVITTPLTWIATTNAIMMAGGTPVFVDIDPATLNLNIDHVKAAITPRTRAILPVHFGGLPVDLDALYGLAEAHGLMILEDAAHSIGAQYKGRRIGSFGHMQAFSFHPNKNMTTAEGGALICHLPEHHARLRAMAYQGIDRSIQGRFGKTGSHIFDVAEPSLKYAMVDLQAALGLPQLAKLEANNKRRSQIMTQYRAAFKDCSALQLVTPPAYDHTHACHLMTVRLTPSASVDRDTFMQKLKEANIGCGLHYQPVHLFTLFRETLGHKEGDFPHAEAAGASICSLPLFPDMTDEDVDDVIQAVYSVLA